MIIKTITLIIYIALLLMCGIVLGFNTSIMRHHRNINRISSETHFSGKNRVRQQSLSKIYISRNNIFSMSPLFAAGAPSKSGGSGGTALDTRVEQKVSTKIRDEIEKNWRLILHDDTIHTIQQVCDIVSASCPLCPGPRAYEVTMEVHMTGAGTVCVANKKIITEYTKILQAAGLTVSMAPDEDFESSGNKE